MTKKIQFILLDTGSGCYIIYEEGAQVRYWDITGKEGNCWRYAYEGYEYKKLKWRPTTPTYIRLQYPDMPPATTTY